MEGTSEVWVVNATSDIHDAILQTQRVAFLNAYHDGLPSSALAETQNDLARLISAGWGILVVYADRRHKTLVGLVRYKTAEMRMIFTRLCVLPEWRRKGLGSMLVQCLVKDATRLGLTEVKCRTRASEIDLAIWYARHGFQISQEAPVRRDGCEISVLSAVYDVLGTNIDTS